MLRKIIANMLDRGHGARARIESGHALLASGDADGAESLCVDVLQEDPDNAMALELLADVGLRRALSAHAMGLLRSGIARNADRGQLHFKLGCLLEDAGDLPSALASYTAALRVDPAMVKAHNNMGATLQKMGRLDAALQCFEKARDLDPGLWQAHYNVGNCHKLAGNLAAAVEPFQYALRLRRARGARDPALSSLFAPTSRSKLLHDIEQRAYLIERHLLPPEEQRGIDALRQALLEVEPQLRSTEAVTFPQHLEGAADYNHLVHFHDSPRVAGSALNPAIDRQRIEQDYFGRAPGMTYVDDFLTPAALAELRRFCMESTIWFDCLYSDGYVGSTLEDGFVCPLLAQIAEELPRALPGIFGEHKLTHLWGYKYDSERSGITEHADFAAVNVNFWLTPDDANLAPESGGLVVWDKEAPLDWDFDEYNRDPARIRRFLAESGASAFTVPHRQNRVVIFNSDLFHKTDAYRFKPGYANRRLNVTFLYGFRQARDDPSHKPA